MHHVYIDSEINEEFLNGLIKELQQAGDQKIKIYLRSDGGNTDIAEVIIDTINDYSDRLTLIASTYIGSAAFYIFYMYRGEKKIMPGCVGMWHVPRIKTDVYPDGALVTDEGQDLWIEASKKDFEKFNSIMFFSSEELQKLQERKNVNFTTQRMQYFLQKQLGHSIATCPATEILATYIQGKK